MNWILLLLKSIDSLLKLAICMSGILIIISFMLWFQKAGELNGEFKKYPGLVLISALIGWVCFCLVYIL